MRHAIVIHVDEGGAAPLLARHLVHVTLHDNAATMHAPTEQAETRLLVHGHVASRPHDRVPAGVHDTHTRRPHDRAITRANNNAITRPDAHVLLHRHDTHARSANTRIITSLDINAESAALTQASEIWAGSHYHFYADEDTVSVDEETGEQVSINSDNIEDNLPVGATITMTDRYTPVTVTRIDERSYKTNGYETDHSGAPYDAGDALDFIFKWYGTCTRHTITRP